MIFKRRDPLIAHRAPGILPRLAILAEPLQHRVARPGQRFVAHQYLFAHRLIFPFGAQLLELVVQVEDQRGMLEPAGGATGAGMQANDEIGFAAETQRKMGIGRIGADPLVIILAPPRILVAQRLHPVPQGALERLLRQVIRPFEYRREAAEQPRLILVGAGKAQQRIMHAQVIPCAVDAIARQRHEITPRQRGLRADAGKGWRADMILQLGFELGLGLMGPGKHAAFRFIVCVRRGS